MPFSDYSLTPSDNVTIGGTSTAEGWSPGNVNDAFRQIMADAKAFSLSVPDTSTLVTKSNGVFTNQPTVTARGALLHHNNAANASGRVFIQAAGGAVPTMSNGDILLEY